MPYKNVLELCKEIRDQYDLPVILLTAKNQLTDKEKGYHTGKQIHYLKVVKNNEL